MTLITEPSTAPSDPEAAATTAPRRSGELPALDALRALAAIAVLGAHVYQLFALRGTEVRWARAGDVGVYVFFVLSGYLIAASVLRPAHLEVRSYLIRRAARIVPLFYASMVVAVLLIDPTPLFSGKGRIDLAVHVLLLHGLFRDFRYSINGVYWTLTIEWLFYLLMALVAPVFRRARAGWVVAGGMVVLGLAWRTVVVAPTPDPGDAAYFFQQLPGTADLFGVGMLLALALRTEWFGRLLASAPARLATAVGSVAVVIAMLALYDQRKPVFWDSRFMVMAWPLVLGVGLTGVLAVLVTGGSLAHAAARWSGLAYLGMVSYGIYLFHPVVIGALLRAWAVDDPVVPVLPFTAAALAVTVLVAVAAHHTVERPPMRWARAVTRRRSTP